MRNLSDLQNRRSPGSELGFGEAGGANAAHDGGASALARRIGAWLLHEARQALAPTLFFLVGFNLIVLTTNLLVAPYLVAVGNFFLATMSAFIVGKAVLIANNLALIRLFDRAPLLAPILFKTGVYWVIVFLVRLLERVIHFWIVQGNPLSDFPSYLAFAFSWDRFVAISLWIFALFFIYVTAAEFAALFGPGEIPRLLLTRRPSELSLTRRQRIRELLRLSRLADEHSFAELDDPKSVAHGQMVDVVRRLAR